jgi:Ca-activated chloride channel family protein
MRFAAFRAVYVLAGVVAAVLAVRRARKRNCFAHSLAHQPIFGEMHPSHLRLLPSIARGLAVAAVGLALMDPRIASREAFARFEGLDVILAIDLSSSMMEALGGWEAYRKSYETWAAGRGFAERHETPDIPLPETRLQAVREALAGFVAKRKQDRIALVAFSEHTYVISPLTTDHRYVDKYVHMLDADILIGEGVTAIGDGIDAAIAMFRKDGDAETRNKVIVVFTDGESNFGRDPLEVLSEARYYGYRVYLVGVDLGPEVTRKDAVQQLIKAVEDTGGQYFDALNKERLEDAYRTIDRLEKGVFAQRTIERDVPAFPLFACLSFALLFGGAVLDAVPYFIDIS